MAALLNAVNSGNESTIGQLIANSPGSKNTEFRRNGNLIPFTPLLRAVSINNFEMVQHLLEKGANPNLANAEGVTPLRLAAEKGNLSIVRILLDYGADPLGDAELFDYVLPGSNVNQTLRSRVQGPATRRGGRRRVKRSKSRKGKRRF